MGLNKNLELLLYERSFKRMKRKATDQEKIVSNHMSNKRLVSRLYKELLKLNSLKNIHTKNKENKTNNNKNPQRKIQLENEQKI